jgi:hypothetical protein
MKILLFIITLLAVCAALAFGQGKRNYCEFFV